MSQQYDRDELAELFDNIVKRHISPYDNIPGGVLDIQDQTCLRRLDLKPTDRLLDFGTGTGRMAIIAARECSWVTGLDISHVSLEFALENSQKERLDNTEFIYGALEDPPLERLKTRPSFNKVLILNALGHLPDDLKCASLDIICDLLDRPGRLVIGDQMLFESPEDCPDTWDEIRYDGGETDFPTSPQFLIEWLEESGGSTQIDRLHPLLGVITADFS